MATATRFPSEAFVDLDCWFADWALLCSDVQRTGLRACPDSALAFSDSPRMPTNLLSLTTTFRWAPGSTLRSETNRNLRRAVGS